ncbi:hypothetical protein BDY21DRAFT_335887 [Lineolata rhizophorae]|uniref:Geranylgeranyl transferase type-2 subunit alpha n=1 Tax=Lineolata rhizophorae TaxID=578093 RepID=A0A6A6PB21_9PEZI|nr:hypothetical protein BDY21DRAFT_335887 [Lineolata rhizophorae]
MASHGIPRVSSSEVPTEQSRLKEAQKIVQYRHLADLVNHKYGEGQLDIDSLSLTSKLLTKNPEYYSIWNYRRRILQHLMPNSTPTTNSYSYENELKFLLPLLIQFPKCYWIWNHRVWVLEQADTSLPLEAALAFWREELGLVSKMLARDSRNFHGWRYRRLVVKHLEALCSNHDVAEGSSLRSTHQIVEDEFDYTTKMIETNLSNFSAWHNRSLLIPRLLDNRQAGRDERKVMFESELALIHKALYTDPYDQSLWYYHNYLLQHFDPAQQQSATTTIYSPSNEESIHWLRHELDLLRELCDDEDGCRWIYQALVECSTIYTEVDRDTQHTLTRDLQLWLQKLQDLDPLRFKRWKDAEAGLLVRTKA